jgi:hypothetical protein
MRTLADERFPDMGRTRTAKPRSDGLGLVTGAKVRAIRGIDSGE